MKLFGPLFLIVFLLSMFFASGQETVNNFLGRKISIEFHNEPVATLLEKVALKAKVYFSYDARLIELDKNIDAKFSDKTLKEILDLVLGPGYSYQEMGDQIVITKGLGEIEIADSQGLYKQTTYIRLLGRVLDGNENFTLPYVVVALQNRNLASISNLDGEFEFKVPFSMVNDTIVFLCMGYKQLAKPVREMIGHGSDIYLQPNTILLKEIKVTAISPFEILERLQSKIILNYSSEEEFMHVFYRELLEQDNQYIDVAEAAMELRKSSYSNTLAVDKVKYLKGRKSKFVERSKYVDFKMQGGPYYITQLDVIKTKELLFNEDYLNLYKFTLKGIVEFNNRETYVLHFKPKEKQEDAIYNGNLYVDMASFALVQAEFELNKQGLKMAQESLIRKKPNDFYVRPVKVDYQISYRKSDNYWHLSYAHASAYFRVKSKNERINSLFHSTSEMLVSKVLPEIEKPIHRKEAFSKNDIFMEVVEANDTEFWAEYNIIKPSNELRKSLITYIEQNDSLFRNQKDEIHILPN
jgi:hypothetical protein